MSKQIPVFYLFRPVLLFIAAFVLPVSGAYAQEALPQSLTLSAAEVALPPNAGAYLDSFRRQAKVPVQVLVQLRTLADEGTKQELASGGVVLVDFVGANAYLALIRPEPSFRGTVIRSIVPVQPDWKISGEVLPMKSSKEPVALMVSCIPGTNEQELSAFITALGGSVHRHPLSEHSFFEVSLPGTGMKRLAGWHAVLYISPAAKDEPLNSLSVAATKANIAKAPVASGGYGLLGDSIVVGVGDNSSGLYHIDTRDRVINYNYAPYSNHGQHVNGTVGSAGIVDPKGEGFAPHATLVDHLYSYVWERTAAMFTTHNMTVTNNSYGNRLGNCTYAGVYDVFSRALDSIALAYPMVLHVFASGNDGTATCSPYPTGYRTIIGGYQTAKNVIVVGNARKGYDLNGGSSKGPVRDGRIRPDITAIGSFVHSTKEKDAYMLATGTSMASPQVAGGAALLQQHYKRTHGGAYPTSALTKTLLMNGAMDMGAAGPDFMYGYGMMDMQRSLKMIDSNWYSTGSISNSGNQTPLTINVPANTAQLKVMLYWHDAPANPIASTQLVNDLDLKVTAPSSAVHLPFVLNPAPANVGDTATVAADHLNNVEQVVIDNPAAGSYTVGVNGYAVPSVAQAYVVAYDIVPKGITVTAPTRNATHITNDPASSLFIYWTAPRDPNTFTLEYSTNGGSTWSTISSSVPSGDRQYNWVPPAGINSGNCYVRVTRNVTMEQGSSGPFSINDLSVLSLNTTQCPGYVNLTWTSVPNATGYNVLRKAGLYLQTVASTTDTFYYASGLSTDSIYYFTVEPLFGSVKGYRALAVSRQPNTGACTGTFSDNDLMMDSLVTPATGRIGTSTALSSSQTLTLLIRNLDDAAVGSYKISYQLNGGSWQSQTLSSLAASSSALVSFTGLNMATAGAYTIRAAIENLSATDPVRSNDTIVVTVRQLQNTALNLSSASVTEGFEGLPALTFLKDTVGFAGGERWDYFNNNDTGRMRTFIDNEIAITGSRAISMDMLHPTPPAPAFNRLVGTFDLSSYSSSSEVRLEFDYKLHGSPSRQDSNKVFVRGADFSTWVPLFPYNINAPVGQTQRSGSISITDVLNGVSQSFSTSTQLAFGQYDSTVIASNEDGNGITLDNIKVYLVSSDVGISAITSPAAVNCALTSSTPVSVTVFNGVSATASNITVSYQLDGGSIVSETLASLAGKTSTAFTFAQSINASGIGQHTLKVWAGIAGDGAPVNDTMYLSFRNEPLISSFPYLENFESSDGYWWAEGYRSTWEWGTPAAMNIKKAASGVKAWKTNLDGYYNDREVSYLYSPCFDISSLSTPMLSMSVNMEIENCGAVLCDGAWIEYSIGGGTWTKLGTNGQGTNWYNSSAFQLWNVESPVRWRVASIALPAASQTLRLRVAFAADAGVSLDGIAIDDIHIFDRANPIYTGGAVGPVTQSVSGSGYTSFTSGGALLAQISAGNSSSLGNTDVSLFAHSNIINTGSQQYFLPKNFVVNTQNAPTDSVTARLFITDADVVTLVSATGCAGCSRPADAYELGITKYDNSNTSLENGSLSDNVGGTYMFIPYTKITWVPYDAGYYGQVKLASFSELWFNNGGPANAFPLPVAGVEFDARKSGDNSVLLSWLSHVDTQVTDYELQRSTDASGWSVIANIQSVGNNANRYAYTDRPGVNAVPVYYYRLKYTLRSGKEYYTTLRQVIWSGRSATLAVYPNPTADGRLRIDWSTQPGVSIEGKITDVSGRTVAAWNDVAGGYQNVSEIDLSHVAKGMYFLHATVGGERFDVKIVRQ